MAVTEIDQATVERIQRFYCECRLKSMDGAPRRNVPGMDGFRKIEFEEGDLRFRDLYTRSLGTHISHSLIAMWYQGRRVWAMSCSGMYERRALPPLKAALRKSYEAREFVGGRGPMIFEQSPYIYMNEMSCRAFSSPEGHESVWELDPEGKKDNLGFPIKHSIGGQRYHGGLLVSVSR